MPQHRSARVALRCDAGRTIGVGHVMRSVALGEELAARGHEVLLWGDLGGLKWLARMADAHGFPVCAAPLDPQDCARAASEMALDAVVIDGYHLHPGLGSALGSSARRILTIVDYDFGVQQRADVYVDQNLGAIRDPGLAPGAVSLAGIDYALFRNTVLQHRRTAPQEKRTAPQEKDEHPDPARIVAVFGGTDPFGAAPVVLSALLATGVPLEVTVVTNQSEIVREVFGHAGPGQRVQTVAPHPDFGALVADADLVLSASGSSVWELLCMGIPTAVVCVADNQVAGYRQCLDHEVVAGLGQLGHFDAVSATATLTALLADPDARDGLAARGLRLVDGRGRERVADALLP